MKSYDAKPTSNDEDLLKIARKRFELAVEAENEIRADALDDQKFLAGEQWPSRIKQARESDNRPCLVINRLPQTIRQITNDQRQNRPSIKVYPVDDKADVETAKVFQGLIRHIEYNSNAEVAYDTAFEGAVTKGLGYFRIVTDYVNPLSFDQEILIKRIKNSFSVYLDPFSKEPDGSDAKWGFIVEDVPKEDYKASYGESKLAKEDNWGSIGDTAPGWATDESCRVAEYFYTDFKTVKIVLLADGQTVEESALKELFPDGIDDEFILDRREAKVPQIKWVKLNAIEVLERTDWLGQWIPIIPVLGNEMDVDGKRILEGVVRNAKDPQRMYNYQSSNEAESIALAPKAPFVAAVGQIKGLEAQWQQANIKNFAVLQYNPIDVNGTALPPPQRNSIEPAVMAITQAKMGAAEDIKATTGIYDASLGARSNENSGIAIQRRNLQAQTSNFHFIDNLSRSIRHAGRILVDLIPHIYDTARAQRIIGEEGDQQIVRINEAFEKGGEQVEYNLSKGKYDVVVETGPSFATKRQEAAASMMDFTRNLPQQATLVLDLIAKNMDWPGASEFAERFKKTLPPGIAESDGNRKPLPPEVLAQMQQMDQMIQGLTEQLKIKTEQINTKSLELESKERIEMAKLETQAAIKLAEIESKDLLQVNAISNLQQQILELDARTKQLGMSTPPQVQPEFQEFNPEFAPDQIEQGDQQQPTGGFSPGPYPGE